MNQGHKRSITSVTGTSSNNATSMKVSRHINSNQTNHYSNNTNSNSKQESIKSLTPTRNIGLSAQKSANNKNSIKISSNKPPTDKSFYKTDESTDGTSSKNSIKDKLVRPVIGGNATQRTKSPSLINSLINPPNSTLKSILPNMIKKTPINNPTQIKSNNTSTGLPKTYRENLNNSKIDVKTNKSIDKKKGTINTSNSFDKSFNSNSSTNSKLRQSNSKSPTFNKKNTSSKSPTLKKDLRNQVKTPVPISKNSLLKQYEELKNKRVPSPINYNTGTSKPRSTNSPITQRNTNTAKPTIQIEKKSEYMAKINTKVNVQSNREKERDNKFKNSNDFREMNTSPLIRVHKLLNFRKKEVRIILTLRITRQTQILLIIQLIINRIVLF